MITSFVVARTLLRKVLLSDIPSHTGLSNDPTGLATAARTQTENGIRQCSVVRGFKSVSGVLVVGFFVSHIRGAYIEV